MTSQPILSSSCARATTAAETRYRIDVAIAPSRGARVVALDDGAAGVIRRVAEEPWATARFLTWESGAKATGIGGQDYEQPLRTVQGETSEMADELSGADVAVMVATADDGAQAAAAIGRACSARGIMTAGLVLGDAHRGEAVAALRPYARVLLVSSDERDVSDMLSALRA